MEAVLLFQHKQGFLINMHNRVTSVHTHTHTHTQKQVFGSPCSVGSKHGCLHCLVATSTVHHSPCEGSQRAPGGICRVASFKDGVHCRADCTGLSDDLVVQCKAAFNACL